MENKLEFSIPSETEKVEIKKIFKPSTSLKKKKKAVSQVLKEGMLMTFSNKRKAYKEHYYKLYIDKFEKYVQHKNDIKLKSTLNLNGVICEIYDLTKATNDFLKKLSLVPKYSFSLRHNSQFDFFFINTKEEFNSWEASLKSCLVLANYGHFYTNVKYIGRGDYVKIAIAKKINEEKLFTVKAFNKTKILKENNKEIKKAGVLNEINIMRTLSHDNIVKLYEVYEGESHIYMVMDLLDGGKLIERLLSPWKCSEKEAFEIIYQILIVLEYLHSKNIMHRDINPENIVFTNKESLSIKVSEFGLSDYVVTKNKTRLYDKCGTAGYVAPEILSGKKYNEKVDIFSAGVIFYILLTKESPFDGVGSNEILKKNQKCNVDFNLKKFQNNISSFAISLLIKMLQKDPKKRITAKKALKHHWISMNKTVEIIYEENTEFSKNSIKDDFFEMNEEDNNEVEIDEKNRSNEDIANGDNMKLNFNLIRNTSINNENCSPIDSPIKSNSKNYNFVNQTLPFEKSFNLVLSNCNSDCNENFEDSDKEELEKEKLLYSCSLEEWQNENERHQRDMLGFVQEKHLISFLQEKFPADSNRKKKFLD